MQQAEFRHHVGGGNEGRMLLLKRIRDVFLFYVRSLVSQAVYEPGCVIECAFANDGEPQQVDAHRTAAQLAGGIEDIARPAPGGGFG